MGAIKDEQVSYRTASVRAEFPFNIVEISSSSEKSSTGRAPENGEEATSSRKGSSPCTHKKLRLDINSFFECRAACGNGDLSFSTNTSEARDGDPENRNFHVEHEAADIIDDDDDDLPDDFLAPLDSPISSSPTSSLHTPYSHGHGASARKMLKQFWKAGDYESVESAEALNFSSGLEHVRVHPKFLHSNATSHKWALGAMAELLDNALDEAVNGATFVNVDMVKNPRDGRPMVMVEDDGGGMNPDRMRQCMSLGYSAKSKMANTIGQYGNGFKTSTMRLGADVLVFSRHQSREGFLPTQSIGLLSYTFLTKTGQDDIIVPMLDYEVHPFGLKKLMRGTLDDWNKNLGAILQWSPYDMEQGLFEQLQRINGHGTVIIVYNLWEDDEGNLELDFDADPHDIQLKGTSRDEKSVAMASKYLNCKHYFTYRYSLRSYASILYLRLPKKFRIFLRGEQVMHHRLRSDLMTIEQVKYKPQKASVLSQKDSTTVVILGFVKDAKEHIDVQGFNVYHKNRLIKPFWRVWNYSGIQGRGIFGVLEANFVEPAHDKQGFERTTVFARLEARLIEMQKSYWWKHCREIGYMGGASKSKGSSKVEGRRDMSAEWIQQLSLPAPVVPRGTPTPLQRNPHKSMEPSTRDDDRDVAVSLALLPMASEEALVSRGMEMAMIIEESLVSRGIEMAMTSEEALVSNGTEMAMIREEAIVSRGKEVSMSSEEATVSRGKEVAMSSEEDLVSRGTEIAMSSEEAIVSTGKEVAMSSEEALVSRGMEIAMSSKEALVCKSMETEPQLLECTAPTPDMKASSLELAGISQLASQSPTLQVSSLRCLAPLDTCHTNPHTSLSLEVRQDSNEALVSPSSSLEAPYASQLGRGYAPNASVTRTQVQQRGSLLARSMLQLRQSNAKEAAQQCKSADSGSNTQKPVMDVSLNVNGPLARGTQEDGDASVITDCPGSDVLETKLETMKERVRSLQSDIEKVYHERDSLNRELEEERRWQAMVEEELKKKLEALLSKANELEVANKLMVGCPR